MQNPKNGPKKHLVNTKKFSQNNNGDGTNSRWHGGGPYTTHVVCHYYVDWWMLISFIYSCNFLYALRVMINYRV